MTLAEGHDLARRMVAAWFFKTVGQRADAVERAGGRDAGTPDARWDRLSIALVIGCIIIMVVWCSLLAYGAWWLVSHIVA
jgi:hypothetical protein